MDSTPQITYVLRSMIALFDSGIGGLTVAREVLRQLPGYDITYFGDAARLPYGNKSPDVIRRFSLEITDFLIARGAKIIIIACNTASSLAADAVRERAAKSGVLVFEVVTPAVEAAARKTRNGRVGVFGTRGTVGSGVYQRTMAAHTAGEKRAVKVHANACPLFVPLVEEGWVSKPETLSIAKKYAKPLLAKKIDTLILGCTHYPFLKSVIAKAAPRVTLIDPARETVAAVKRAIEADLALKKSLGRGNRAAFPFTDVSEHSTKLASKWLGRKIMLEKVVLDKA